MTIRYLRIFRAVCKAGSVTEAADALYMTQPAVSHAIQELEAEVGTALFDRVSRRIRLNEAGKRFLGRAVRVLDEYDGLEQDIRELERRSVLRLGSSITIANFWLPGLMKRFGAAFPDTPVRVEIGRAEEITGKLEEGELDLALIEGVVQARQLEAVPFASYRLAVVCAPEYPLAARGSVPLRELASQRLLLRERGSAIRDTLDSALLLCGCAAEPAWVSVNSQALIRAVEAGLGVSVLPDILVAEELRRGALVEVEVPDTSLVNENHVAVRREKFRTGPMRAFWQLALGEAGGAAPSPPLGP